MTTYQRIAFTSRWLAILCLGLLLLLPFYLAHHWLLSPDLWLDGMPFSVSQVRLDNWPPSAEKQVLGIAISYLPGLLIAKGLWHLRQLFILYSNGTFFSEEHIALYAKSASAVLWFVLVWIVSQSLMSIAMSYDTDTKVVSLTFTHAHAIALLSAMFLKVITWIMSAAQELAAENQSFV